MVNRAFEKLLLEAVDEALASLGDSAKQAIYFHLENRFEIGKEEIPQHIEDLAEGLEKIFGVGAQFLEILIMKELYKRVGKPLEWNENEELIFSDYVIAARRSFLKSRKKG